MLGIVDYLNFLTLILLVVVSAVLILWVLRSGQLKDRSPSRPVFSPLLAAASVLGLIVVILIIINIINFLV